MLGVTHLEVTADRQGAAVDHLSAIIDRLGAAGTCMGVTTEHPCAAIGREGPANPC
jgi:hypothetical protein